MVRFPCDVPARYRHRDMPVGMQLAPPSRGGHAARTAVRSQVRTRRDNADATLLRPSSSTRSNDPRAVPDYIRRRGPAKSNQIRPSNAIPRIMGDDKIPKTHDNASDGADGTTDSELSKEDTEDQSIDEDTEDQSLDEDTEDQSLDEDETQSLDEDNETPEQFKTKFTDAIQKMMFVSGETAEPSQETTTLIEEIVRQQVIEMLTRGTALAARRGVRSISTDDLIFLIRHDKAKVSRLKTFLSWKDVRKNVKDSDDKGGGDAADFGGADDPLAGAGVAGPTDVAAKPKNKRAKVGLPWDVNSFYSIQVPEREDEEDEDEEEQNYATLQRLANADERTKHMTKEEYVFWSDCRQASFTFRKGKRFREWAGFGIVTDSRPNDDIVDILGFLTFEIVQTLTEGALKVKEQADRGKKGREMTSGENGKKRKREPGLFDPPAEGRTPIEPRHIHEAYRKLQATPNKAVAMLLHGGRAPLRTSLRLI